MTKFVKYTKEWLEELCKDSYSYAEVLRKAGRKQGGGACAHLRKLIAEFGIDVSHFTGKRWHESPNQPPQEKYQPSEIFVKNSLVPRNATRAYIIRHNLIPYRCKECGCDGHWKDGVIALELHHIDGDKKNHELSNLCFLCPNCHALTETYRGKNKKLKNMKRTEENLDE